MRKVSGPMEALQLGGERSVLRTLLPGLALVAACALLLAARHELDQQSAGYAQQLADLEADRRAAAARRAASAPERLSDAALVQIGRQVGLINRDWSRLLSTLVPTEPDVRLLMVDVDPAAGTVRVSGAGHNAHRANEYSALLEERGVVEDVRLIAVERSGDQVLFEVVARWRD